MVKFVASVAFVVASSLFAVLPAGAQTAGDVKGAADHPLVPRYKGAEIRHYNVEQFSDYAVVTGQTKRGDGNRPVPETALPVDGKITHLIYRAPADRSSLEVFRNYEEALKSVGFETIYSCARADCGFQFNRVMNPAINDGLLYDKEQRYLAAKLARPQGDVYVALYVTTNEANKRAFAKVDVVELKPMEQRMVVVKADEMEQALTRDGKIAIYGILFDFDKADIKAESKPQIDQLGELLKKNPKLDVLIVGHTDGQGTFDYNLSLSQRRAQAIASALTASGIAANRLTPAGAGMVAPVASNRTEDGRTKNRRVEIVERVPSTR
ncbi:OmpA family protein [Reyranella sp.]|uniref:OmpA family protein n=1 Tax=Reyranella sp. TaxID=1929291 RepID=UPI0011F8CD47|nr:OmpA family protein [Reyranella sp.]TAJ84342.1 MAG: DUF4892 domain-containing protein [Reyranella sp.]